MSFKLSSPVFKSFILDRTDNLYPSDGPSTTVTVRQATKAHDIERTSIFSEISRVVNLDDESSEVTFKQKLNMDQLQQLEVYLTLVDCNITVDGENGETVPLFKFKPNNKGLDMSRSEFERSWGRLPSQICGEIHEKVLEVNYTWAGKTEDQGK